MATPPLRVNGVDFPDGNSLGLSASGHGVIRYNNSSHQFEASVNGGAYAALGGGGGGSAHSVIYPNSAVAVDATVQDQITLNVGTSPASLVLTQNGGVFEITSSIGILSMNAAGSPGSLMQLSASELYIGIGGAAQTIQTATKFAPLSPGGLTIGEPAAPFGASYFQRQYTIGTALVSGNFALSAAWGSTASVSVTRGDDNGFVIVVTCNGTGITSNPTITLVYQDGTWTTAPVTQTKMSDASNSADLSLPVKESTTATTLTITLVGTPTSGRTYTFSTVVRGL